MAMGIWDANAAGGHAACYAEYTNAPELGILLPLAHAFD